MARLDVVEFSLPFKDYREFYDYWIEHGAYGSWQARRDILNKIFGPARTAVRSKALTQRRARLAEGVTSIESLGWPAIDGLLDQVGRRFRSARGPADFRAVGLDCVAVLDSLSGTLFDPSLHLREGEVEPSVDQSKNRLERVVEVAAQGASNADLRRLIRAAAAYAHHVKHQSTPSRSEAGMAADATILVAHLLRRLVGSEAIARAQQESGSA